jgi:hypothetical protein
MLKYFPSSAAFQVGGVTLTKNASGCLRYIKFANAGLRDSDIDPIYKAVGAAHEAEWERTLISKNVPYHREVPLKKPIPNSNMEYSGRIDFIVEGELQECKATISKRARLDIIRKGNVKLNHLAQLVSYMAMSDVHNGRLIVGYYELDGEVWRNCEQREFEITIDDSGRILVDKTPSGYSVLEQLSHMFAASKAVTERSTPERPMDWQQKWSSPCAYCAFKNACNKDGTIEQAKEALNEFKKKPKKQVEVTKYKKPKGAKNVS